MAARSRTWLACETINCEDEYFYGQVINNLPDLLSPISSLVSCQFLLISPFSSCQFPSFLARFPPMSHTCHYGIRCDSLSFHHTTAFFVLPLDVPSHSSEGLMELIRSHNHHALLGQLHCAKHSVLCMMVRSRTVCNRFIMKFNRTKFNRTKWNT